MADLSFPSCGAAPASSPESFNGEVPSALFEENSDFDLDIEIDIMPDAQLATMFDKFDPDINMGIISDAELATMLEKQHAPTAYDDKQWHVPDDISSMQGAVFDLPATNLMAHMGMLQLVAAEELRVIQQQEAERRMAAFQSFVESWTTPFGANVFLNPDGLVTRPIVDNILGDVPEVDARLKITSLTALAKVEALALIGATLFREATFRSKNCHVTWPRFTMPHAPEAGIDKYGRDHVVPEWFGNSDNREFLTQLQFRMKLVECPARQRADDHAIMVAACKYLRTLQKRYRDSWAETTPEMSGVPQNWRLKDDPNAFFRDRILTSAGC